MDPRIEKILATPCGPGRIYERNPNHGRSKPTIRIRKSRKRLAHHVVNSLPTATHARFKGHAKGGKGTPRNAQRKRDTETARTESWSRVSIEIRGHAYVVLESGRPVRAFRDRQSASSFKAQLIRHGS